MSWSKLIPRSKYIFSAESSAWISNRLFASKLLFSPPKQEKEQWISLPICLDITHGTCRKCLYRDGGPVLGDGEVLEIDVRPLLKARCDKQHPGGYADQEREKDGNPFFLPIGSSFQNQKPGSPSSRQRCTRSTVHSSPRSRTSRRSDRAAVSSFSQWWK